MSDGHWQLEGSAAELYQRYLVPAITTKWADDLVHRAQLRAGEDVLDVACGTGVVARLAARKVTPGHVTGLDLNSGMLAVARNVSNGREAISWKEGSALDLPFPSGHFDVVLCQLGLQFFPDQLKALREMRRVVLDSGRLALSVYSPIERTPGANAFVRALDEVLEPEASRIKRGEHSFASPAQLENLWLWYPRSAHGCADNRIPFGARLCSVSASCDADDSPLERRDRPRASGNHLIGCCQGCVFIDAVHARWRQVHVPAGGICRRCAAF
jgi:SAM-dependent methyltransferase